MIFRNRRQPMGDISSQEAARLHQLIPNAIEVDSVDGLEPIPGFNGQIPNSVALSTTPLDAMRDHQPRRPGL